MEVVMDVAVALVEAEAVAAVMMMEAEGAEEVAPAVVAVVAVVVVVLAAAEEHEAVGLEPEMVSKEHMVALLSVSRGTRPSDKGTLDTPTVALEAPTLRLLPSTPRMMTIALLRHFQLSLSHPIS